MHCVLCRYKHFAVILLDWMIRHVICEHNANNNIIIILYFFKALHQVALSSLQYNRELKHLTGMLNHIHTHTQSFTHIRKIMQIIDYKWMFLKCHSLIMLVLQIINARTRIILTVTFLFESLFKQIGF